MFEKHNLKLLKKEPFLAVFHKMYIFAVVNHKKEN